MNIPNVHTHENGLAHEKIIVYKIYAYKRFVTNTLYSEQIFCTCTNYMYANKIGLYMYTSCDENVGFAQQKSTTDPVKCSAHMNYVCCKVFRLRYETPLLAICVCQSFFFLFLHQINVSCAFVDVNIFCRCANYLVQLQNIRKVDMIVCMCNCLDLYIDHIHNIS